MQEFFVVFLNHENLKNFFDDLKLKIVNLDSELADAAKFLPSYNFEMLKKRLEKLKNQVDEREKQV